MPKRQEKRKRGEEGREDEEHRSKQVRVRAPRGTSSEEPSRSRGLQSERRRLAEARDGTDWKLWGPYLSERQWGTVREDYSADGNCWSHFPQSEARGRAYRWGEDGLLGVCDNKARICLSLALWNGKDPILKERLYGLTGPEGNHGEDVKECYYYLDSLPSHAYMKALYKYPQQVFPYEDLLQTNQSRGLKNEEYEILDTGVFNLRDSKYWDVQAEYAKDSATDLLCKFTVYNRGHEEKEIHVIPQLWFRNTWWDEADEKEADKPSLEADGNNSVLVKHAQLGEYIFEVDNLDEASGGTGPELLFTDNTTNPSVYTEAEPNERKLGTTNSYYKDAFHRHIVNGEKKAVNSERKGTKCGAWYRVTVSPGSHVTIRCRLHQNPAGRGPEGFGNKFLETFTDRIRETEEFYKHVIPENLSKEEKTVARQAYAGLCWTKQYFGYNVTKWLKGNQKINREWRHMVNDDVISMPDKWEFPWYATWDLAFHMIPFADIDPDFAKDQLLLLLSDRYMHPNGQLPAYEFNFSDVNPPVHAWACWRIYTQARDRGDKDAAFLKLAFNRLNINYNWWVNQKMIDGSYIFGGGFLGMDNISCVERSNPPDGTTVLQVDGTAWMGFYSLCMVQMSLELCKEDVTYQDMAIRYLNHFLAISTALNTGLNNTGLWDDVDKFYYDVLRHKDGRQETLKVRSMVGLSALFGVLTMTTDDVAHAPLFSKHLHDLSTTGSQQFSCHESEGHTKYLLCLVGINRLQPILQRMLREDEFLSPFGIRALSKAHSEPVRVVVDDTEHSVSYCPGESESDMFGGNSNWRGPVWICMNYLLLESLDQYHQFYSRSSSVISLPPAYSSLQSVTMDIRRRISNIFLPDKNGRRPCHGEQLIYREENWKDLVLFYEYFHGDFGRGCGASHQTGWTALVAPILTQLARWRTQ